MRRSPRWGSPGYSPQPHRRRSARSLASRSRSALVVVDLEYRLGDEGARQRCPILLRATAQAPTTGQLLFYPDELKYGDQQLVAFSQGTEVFLDHRGTGTVERRTSNSIILPAGTWPLPPIMWVWLHTWYYGGSRPGSRSYQPLTASLISNFRYLGILQEALHFLLHHSLQMATANVSNGEQDFQTEHVRVTFRYSTTPRRPRSTDPARDTVNGHGAAAHDGAPHTSCQAAKVYTSGGMRLFIPTCPSTLASNFRAA